MLNDSEIMAVGSVICYLEQIAGLDGYVISKYGRMNSTYYTVRLRGAIGHGDTLAKAIGSAAAQDRAVDDIPTE